MNVLREKEVTRSHWEVLLSHLDEVLADTSSGSNTPERHLRTCSSASSGNDQQVPKLWLIYGRVGDYGVQYGVLRTENRSVFLVGVEGPLAWPMSEHESVYKIVHIAVLYMTVDDI